MRSLLLVLLVLAPSSLAFGQLSASPNDKDSRPDGLARLLQRIDTNHDGQIDADEIKAAGRRETAGFEVLLHRFGLEPKYPIKISEIQESAKKVRKEAGERYLRLASQKDTSAFQKAAYEQLAKLPQDDLGSEADGSTFALPHGSNDPLSLLYNMGLDVLPILVVALDDDTPTNSIVQRHSHMIGEQTEFWKTNDLVALLIIRIADHYFAINQEKANDDVYIMDVGEHLDLVPMFKKLVLDWYDKNQKKTLAERKIEDISSEFHLNRFDALRWIGDHKEKAGQKAILDRIEVIFSNHSNTLLDSELSECAFALGKLGDKQSIDVVKRICDYLSHDAFRGGSNFDHKLSVANQGLALLQEKNKASQGDKK